MKGQVPEMALKRDTHLCVCRDTKNLQTLNASSMMVDFARDRSQRGGITSYSENFQTTPTLSALSTLTDNTHTELGRVFDKTTKTRTQSGSSVLLLRSASAEATGLDVNLRNKDAMQENGGCIDDNNELANSETN